MIIALFRDNPPHDIWMESRQSQLASTQHLVNKMKTKFPKLKVFPALGTMHLLIWLLPLAYPSRLSGNHESFPVDQVYVSLTNLQLSSPTDFWCILVSYIAQKQLAYGSHCQYVVSLATIRRTADHTVTSSSFISRLGLSVETNPDLFIPQLWWLLHHPGLRIISLNTQYCDIDNFYVRSSCLVILYPLPLRVLLLAYPERNRLRRPARLAQWGPGKGSS